MNIYEHPLGKNRPEDENRIQETQKRRDAFDQISPIIIQELKERGVEGIEIKLIGSVKTGHASVTSDIDISVNLKRTTTAREKYILGQIRLIISQINAQKTIPYKLEFHDPNSSLFTNPVQIFRLSQK